MSHHWQNYFHHHVRTADEFVGAKWVCRYVEKLWPSECREKIMCRCTPNIPSIELQVEYPSQGVFTGKGSFLPCFNKILTSIFETWHFWHSNPNTFMSRLNSLYFPVWKIGGNSIKNITFIDLSLSSISCHLKERQEH